MLVAALVILLALFGFIRIAEERAVPAGPRRRRKDRSLNELDRPSRSAYPVY